MGFRVLNLGVDEISRTDMEILHYWSMCVWVFCLSVIGERSPDGLCEQTRRHSHSLSHDGSAAMSSSLRQVDLKTTANEITIADLTITLKIK